ncbi:MAG: phosphate ABC transporter substrate-binding protein PstS [Leptospirillum sp.]|jgi:phosphate transport system substrate-binding protein
MLPNDKWAGRLKRGICLGLLFLVAGGFRVQESLAADLMISGSSALFPLEQVWSQEYMKHHKNTQISVQSTGSGFGITNAANGNIMIGASDTYLTKGLRARFSNLVSIPVAFEDAEIIYNIPRVDKTVRINMDGPTVARIYLGKIKYWDDPAIVVMNPKVTLPHQLIKVIHRADSSGATFVFTDYLNQTSQDWQENVGRDMLPSWPTGSGYNGSDSLVAAVMATPGAIGYAGLGWVLEYHLKSAALKNRDGEFVVGSIKTIQAAGQAALQDPTFPQDFNRSIVYHFHGKNLYPDANFEFWMVNKNLPGETMRDVKTLLEWVLTTGQNPRYTEKMGFAPIPFRPIKSRLTHILNRLLPGNSYQERSPG